MGQNLAKRWIEKHPDVLPDIVIPAPSTANTAALSFAYELGVRYSEGLYKNPFIGRTFIMPGQAQRKKSIRHKLVPQEIEIRDKKVMIVDDSIVRGNTSRQIVRMVRGMGAKEVYFVTACPPVKNPCFYGVDMPTRSELIAAQKSVDEIRAYIGVDILLYQEIPDLVEAVTRKGDHNIDRPCMACLDGWYVSGNVDEEKKSEMETMRLNDRNGE
jgi:amidophosphoribosyltransferase